MVALTMLQEFHRTHEQTRHLGRDPWYSLASVSIIGSSWPQALCFAPIPTITTSIVSESTGGAVQCRIQTVGETRIAVVWIARTGTRMRTSFVFLSRLIEELVEFMSCN